jgi:membrane fusion protein (multidrug efflux system)
MQQGAVLVPQRAVSEMQGGYLVAVIGQDDKVSIRPVKMGQKVGTWWIVSEGLKTGERIVAEGVQQVQEGAHVNPRPYHETPAIAEKLHGGKAS